jgi:hypothetical protein
MGFCQAGDTARVTFPDGANRDFTDTPITVTCEKGNDSCPDAKPKRSVIFDFYIQWKRQGSIPVRERYVSSPGTTYLPLKSFGIEPIPGGSASSKQFFVVAGMEPLDCSATKSIYSTFDFVESIIEIRLISTRYRSGVPGEDTIIPDNKITVKNSSGVELFSGFYLNCNYSVECIKGCPPNTLDCGDCCLNCASIFNQLSALTQRVLSIT